MIRGIILLSILLGICSYAFAGGEGENSAEMMDDKATVSVFAYLDRSDDVSSTNFDELREEFARLHPDINLEFDYLVGEAYHNKLQALTVADQLPDVMFLWPGKRTGQATGSGKIKDLRPWISGKEDEFAASALEPQGQNGEIWELPEQITATHVMFTNDRLLDELGLSFPSTLQELLDQGEIIREAGYIPIAMDNKDGWQMQSCLLSALVERTAGKDWLDRARVGDAKFTDPEFVSALEVINILSEADMFSPGINQAEYGRALTDFVTGNAVYLIDGGWRTSNIVGELPEGEHENISFNVFPAVPNEKGQQYSTSIVAGTGYGMNANLSGEQADAAWEWIWFFAGPDGSRVKQAQGWLPAYKLPPTDDTPLLQRKLSEFLNSVQGGYVIDAVMDAEGMGVLHSSLQEMMFGNITPEQAAQEYEEWVSENDSSRT